MNSSFKKLVVAALLIALCFVGANIKIMGSIAFDAVPAFIGVLLLGYGYGAVIGAIGHLFSALLAGFPLSLPVHLVTAVFMAITMVAFLYVFRLCSKKMPKIVAYIIAGIVAVIINAPLSLFVLQPLLFPGAFATLFTPLSIAATANVVVAILIYALGGKQFHKILGFNNKK